MEHSNRSSFNIQVSCDKAEGSFPTKEMKIRSAYRLIKYAVCSTAEVAGEMRLHTPTEEMSLRTESGLIRKPGDRLHTAP
jgi:hypothetical protein